MASLTPNQAVESSIPSAPASVISIMRDSRKEWQIRKSLDKRSQLEFVNALRGYLGKNPIPGGTGQQKSKQKNFDEEIEETEEEILEKLMNITV